MTNAGASIAVGRSARSSARLSRSLARGVTLFEVLIVIALIALLGGTVLFGSGMLGSSRIRSGATLISSAIRLAATKANTSGRPTRLVFDFDTQSLNLEEASGSRMLREKAAPAGGAEAATDLEKKARSEVEHILEGPKAARTGFSPVASFAADAAEPEKGRKLEPGIEFASVQTDHDEDPVASGRAYLYFWPGGVTERAHIQLRRKGVEGGMTVEVSSLTGRAKIETGLVDLPKPRSDDEEDQGEREE